MLSTSLCLQEGEAADHVEPAAGRGAARRGASQPGTPGGCHPAGVGTLLFTENTARNAICLVADASAVERWVAAPRRRCSGH